jgi:arabinose-5-phosphate isomerase
MQSLIEFGKQTIQSEIAALQDLLNSIDTNFSKACDIITNCTGKVVIMGMGKSGHIGAKIAATFASTGTPSFFVHPAEAGHGDLGMIEKNDVVIYISYSGTASEITALIPIIARQGNNTIAITGNEHAEISNASDVWLNGAVQKEACPHNLAPTSSTTVALALGDSLAMAVLQAKGFSVDDFARSHPAGALGKRLLTSVSDIMQTQNLPIITKDMSLLEAISIMSKGQLGLLIIADNNQQIQGVFTDGDLRRVIEHKQTTHTIFDLMHKNPQTITVDKPATFAVNIMEEFAVNALPVVDKDNKVVGAINMQTLIQARII